MVDTENAKLIKSAFSFLGIEPTNDLETINLVWKKLAIECHPDRAAKDNLHSAEERFKLLLNARDISINAARTLNPIQDYLFYYENTTSNKNYYEHYTGDNINKSNASNLDHNKEWADFLNNSDVYFAKAAQLFFFVGSVGVVITKVATKAALPFVYIACASASTFLAMLFIIIGGVVDSTVCKFIGGIFAILVVLCVLAMNKSVDNWFS